MDGFVGVDACSATKRKSDRSPPPPAASPALQEETHCVIDIQGGLRLISGASLGAKVVFIKHIMKHWHRQIHQTTQMFKAGLSGRKSRIRSICFSF